MVSRREAAKGSIVKSGDDDPEYEAKLAEAAAKVKQISRDGSLQSHVHNIMIVGVYLVGPAIIIAVMVWIYHFVAPDGWRFLSSSGIEKLQNMLFSGAVGSGLTGAIKRVSK